MKNSQTKNNFSMFQDPGFMHAHKEISDKDKTIKHYISSGDSNRYGQVLPINGFDETNYRKNPIVMLQHGSSDFFVTTPAVDQLDFVIGSNAWITKEDNYLLALTKFRKGDTAEDVFEGYKQGWLHAWSKFWEPLSEPEFIDGFLTVNKWGIMEYSAVFIPVDTNAVTDLSANKNFFQAAKSSIVKNILSKNIFEEHTDIEIEKLLQPLRDELNSLKAANDIITLELKDLKQNGGAKIQDEINKLETRSTEANNKLKKEIEKDFLNNISLYNKKLTEVIPGIVGGKVIEYLNKIGITNLNAVINEKVAGAIRTVTGKL